MNERLTAKQQKLLVALITEPTTVQAIKSVGVAQSTAYRWLKEDVFKNELSKLRRECMKQTTAKIQGNTQLAVDTLVEVMKDKNSNPPARVSSAKTILEYAYKGLELEEVIERIERIEKIQSKGE